MSGADIGTPTILVVDDDAKIRNLVVAYLRAEHYEVAAASDGDSAIDAVRNRRPDIVILDVVMPGTDGIETLRRIRTFSDVYVIMLTARAEETDKVIGLSVGADDYVTKPFSPRELVARIKAVLRRQRSTPTGDQESRNRLMVFPGLSIDRDRHEVTVDDRNVTLTALEFQLLTTLAGQPGRVFSRRQLLQAVWGWDYVGDDRVVDVHIRNLRKALGDDAHHPRFVGTVRGIGYRFEPEPVS